MNGRVIPRDWIMDLVASVVGSAAVQNSRESAANCDGESDALNGNMINDISVGIIRSNNVRIDINIENILFYVASCEDE